MAFETFLKEGSDKATSKSVYILRIPLIRNYRVGRSHDVEFHIEDISVSRFHGEIQVTKDKVFMQDYKSKYGTQILIKREQVLDQNDCTKNMFQVGRAWMMASFVKKSKVGFFPCCFSAPKATNSIERKNSKLNNSAKRQDTHGNMLDSQLFDKLEQDIEDLQKDRDSVFYLDDDFYNKLIGMYINKDEKRPNKRSIEVYENRETIDDVWGGEYKQEESDNSPDSSSNNNSDDSDDDSARSENSQESDSMGINEQSAEGIGIENQKSNMLSKQESMVRAIPK
uniref:FHA domain-containing protein n=1 Tax=Euplotes crassus TaxID=5936 RepID=A0A7S3KAU9_EUPCR|mmetsp:Transcript_18456/g.18127  ORF Transcript_18456/g.18127 Transcript_18456/m.18127 type:complete len:282 (+) Transcript_18456:994-1839(+)|eukprot:CAMPEP_0197004248 /NCGR_PEP_ID=MMETSP1380-20130617/21067_1 /TAXON_ID=5936 /ORGANISM="Euplotes crassus, Strain CT5" /LENGTH=281 /DNA_ID=CAMNT_0042422979 /DNA_START=994 /DNA_END=1839 /DNA_ORIENTATION=+